MCASRAAASQRCCNLSQPLVAGVVELAVVLICECVLTVSQPLVAGVVEPTVVLVCECFSTVSQPLVAGAVIPL